MKIACGTTEGKGARAEGKPVRDASDNAETVLLNTLW
jgi:hypothetical protein